MFGTYDVINDVNNRHLNVQMSSVNRQPSTVNSWSQRSLDLEAAQVGFGGSASHMKPSPT